MTNKKIEQEQHLKYLFEHNVNLKARVILIKDEITNDTFALVDAAMTELESCNNKSITIRICSDGGDVYAAMAIVGRMNRSKCRVVTEGYGCILSSAVVILAAGKVRRMSEYAYAMYHEASYSVDGKHSHLKNEVYQMENQERMWATTLGRLTGVDKEFWYSKCTQGKDFYMNANEALELHIIDEII